MNTDDMQTAALVLAKCAANDPWFPNGGESTVMAWAEVFSESGLSREDLLAGVARAYRLAEEGFRPLPASIIKHARAAYFEALNNLSAEQREEMNRAHYVLEHMGFLPPIAHRWARRVALGRKPDFELTGAQQEEFQRRMQERRELERSAPQYPAVGWWRGQIGSLGAPVDRDGAADAS